MFAEIITVRIFQDNQQYCFNNLANTRIKGMVVKEDAFKRKYNRRGKIWLLFDTDDELLK